MNTREQFETWSHESYLIPMKDILFETWQAASKAKDEEIELLKEASSALEARLAVSEGACQLLADYLTGCNDMFKTQLTEIEGSNKEVELALADTPYAGSYADGVLYLKAKLAMQAEALKNSNTELYACQSVIHLAGGFDTNYVSGAKAAIKNAEQVISANEHEVTAWRKELEARAIEEVANHKKFAMDLWVRTTLREIAAERRTK